MEVNQANPVLAVHDLERSATWFRDVLGCETVEVDPGNWTFCRSGSVDFMLGRCPEAVPASELDDLDAFHARALATAAEITKPPTVEPWGMREFGLRSPDGHRFMLAESVDTGM